MLNITSLKARSQINDAFDAIIIKLNKRREELLNQIDIIARNKIGDDEIEMDLNFDYLLDKVDTIGNIIEFKEEKYIKNIKTGLEGDSLLLSGYIRCITQNITNMSINKDVEGICLNYYSLNLHLNENDKQQQLELDKQFDILCQKMKETLNDRVENVIIDDLYCRKRKVPLRIIDHAFKSLLQRKPTKVTLAINPSNITMSYILNRVQTDWNDKTIDDMVTLLYDIHLIKLDLPHPEPQSVYNKVFRLINMGLAIFSDELNDEYDEYDQSDDDRQNEMEVDVSVDPSPSSLSSIINPEID